MRARVFSIIVFLPHVAVAFKPTFILGRLPEVGAATRCRACRSADGGTDRWASPQEASDPASRSGSGYPKDEMNVTN